MTVPKLAVRGLVKRFGNGAGAVTALDDINLEVAAGDLVCIVGTSGCGKSTLLKLIAGLETPTEGEVAVDGRPVTGPGPDRGFVFQAYSLYPWRTVAGNIEFGLELAGMPRAERRARVDQYLGVMSLSRWAGRLPRELSGGMRQRVAIARALVTEPAVLLLDEPFGALDAQTKRVMQAFLLEVWQRTGTTIAMVTHDVEEAIYLAQRIFVLTSHPGRIAAEIAVPFGRSRSPAVRRDDRFLDLRDEIDDLLLTQGVGGSPPSQVRDR
ncbi:MAG: ABC transporter ATP-binding protein [Egibacteraceae bacterium]